MKRALIVIDVQNEYFDGAFPITYPPTSVSVPNITAAMDAARAAGVPIVVVQHVDPAGSPVFAEGSATVELHPEVAAAPRDHLVQKQLASSFAGTDLGEWLAASEVDTVVIAGYMTQFCDESTARDAAHRGFAVEFLSDATGSLALTNAAGTVDAKTLHETVLVSLQAGFASVATTAEWIAAVQADEALPEADLYASIVDAR